MQSTLLPTDELAEAADERRRYPRQPINYDAQLTDAKGQSVACKMRDFCRGGLFLSWVDSSVNDTLQEPFDSGDKVTIQFSIRLTSGDYRQFDIKGKVSRCFDSGIGVAFEQPGKVALDVLQRLADSYQEKAKQKPSPTAKQKGGKTDLISQCSEIVRRRLPTILKLYFDQAKERMLLSARDSKSSLEQTRLFDSLKELEDKEEGMKSEVFHNLPDQMMHLGQPIAIQVSEIGDDEIGSLQLLEKEDFEDLLAISDIVSKGEQYYREILKDIEAGFSQLAKTEIDDSNNPLGLTVVCNTIANALQNASMCHSARIVSYEVLEDAFVPGLAELYREIVTLLNKQGLILKTAGTAPVKRPKPKQRQKAVMPEQGMPEQELVDQAPPPAIDLADGLSNGVANKVLDERSDRSTGIPQDQRQPTQAFGSFQDSPRDMLPGFTAAKNLMALSRQAQQTSSYAANTPDPAPPAAGYYQAEEIAQILEGLQRELPDVQGSAGEPVEFKRRLLDRLVGRGDGSKAIAQQHLDSIELMENVLGEVDTDEYMSQQMHGQLRQLYTPLRKLAMLDEGFLHLKSHPARAVLDQVSKIDQAIGVNGDADLREGLDEVVQRLEQDMDNDPDVFANAIQELGDLNQAVSRRYTERVRDVIKDCVYQQAILKGRKKGSNKVAAARPARKMPHEWALWLDRAKQLRPGAAIEFVRGDGTKQQASLIWKGEDNNPFVFADKVGNKVASLTLQELAVQLNRGVAIAGNPAPPSLLDRALQNSLYKLHDNISERAQFDASTGLLKRSRFTERLQEVIADMRENDAPYSLLCIEVGASQVGENQVDENNKPENNITSDTVPEMFRAIEIALEFCHGEEVLTSLAPHRIALLGPIEVSGEGHALATEMVNRYRRQASEISVDSGEEIAVGLVGLQPDTPDSEAVFAMADIACKQAWQAPDHIYVFERTQEAATESLLEPSSNTQWQEWFDKALDEDQVPLFVHTIRPLIEDPAYRPQLEILAGNTCGDEAEINIFDSFAVNSLDKKCDVRLLDRILIKDALRWMADNKARIAKLDVCVINLSESSLQDSRLMEYVLEHLTTTSVPPGKVCFQIQQADAVATINETERLIRTLKEFGCRFGLSNFGSADTQQSNLNNLPVEYLRINPSYVNHMDADADDHALVKSVNELGHLMGKKTIVECSDNPKLLECVKEIGIDYVKGLDPILAIEG